MLMGMRNAMFGGKALPYDAEVEYLESADGSQYIDLGFPVTDQVEMTLEVTRPSNTVRWDCGAEAGWNTNIARLVVINGGTCYWQYGGSTGQAGAAGSSQLVGRVRFTVTQAAVTCTNLTTGRTYNARSAGTTPFTTPGRFLLFAMWNGTAPSTSSSNAGSRLHYFRLSDAGHSVDLIPVRFTNELGVTEGAVYDRVSGELFRNAGTGAFVAGPDTVKSYVQDGLVAMWDGIDNAGYRTHDTSATVWKDLRGDLDMTIASAASNTVPFGDCYADLSSSIAFYNLTPVKVRETILGSQFTVSLVVRSRAGAHIDNANAVFALSSSVFENNYSQRGLSISDNGDGSYSSESFTACQFCDPSYNSSASVHTDIGRDEDVAIDLVFRDGLLYYLKNGTTVHSRSRGPVTSLSATALAFGKYIYNRFDANGRIYAIRLYSRALTAEEIAHNHAIDKARFSLPGA